MRTEVIIENLRAETDPMDEKCTLTFELVERVDGEHVEANEKYFNFD
jgi:hypothetical protein